MEYTERCSEINRERNEALAPIQVEIDQAEQKLKDFESNLANRTDISQEPHRKRWGLIEITRELVDLGFEYIV